MQLFCSSGLAQPRGPAAEPRARGQQAQEEHGRVAPRAEQGPGAAACAGAAAAGRDRPGTWR